MRNIRPIAAKEMIQISRDRRTLGMVVLMPLLQVLIYGFGINTDVKHLRTYVFDQDRTYFSRRLVAAFGQSGYFDIKAKVRDMQSLRRALDKGLGQTALVIPPRFAADTLKGKGAPVQMLIDGTDSTPANVAMNASQAVVVHFMQSEGFMPAFMTAMDFRPRLWYNPDLKSAYFMLPGLIALILQLIVPMITANAIVREKEQGNIEQLLVTPIRPYELVIGKILPYILIGLVIAASIVVAMHFIFGVPIRGSLLTLFVMTLVYLIVCLGIGLWASTIAQNQQQASQIVMFFAMPSILLSGFIFPRETMPVWVHHIGYILPMTYFLKIVRGIILKGMGFADLWDQALPLVFMAAAVLLLSAGRFGKRMD